MDMMPSLERPQEAVAAREMMSRSTREAEMDEFVRYGEINEQPIEGVRMSRGEFDETGRYAPGHIEAIEPEAKEYDPEMQELDTELHSWFEQGEQTSCCVATQTMVINQLEDGEHTEAEMLEVARENGWYHEGTAPMDVGKVAEAEGMDVHRYFGCDMDELAVANDPEVKVLANVDCVKLQYPDCDRPCRPNHSVQVLRVEDTPEGRMVIINDPGHPGGRGAVYPMEVFEKACNGDITTIRKGVLTA